MWFIKSKEKREPGGKGEGKEWVEGRDEREMR